MLFVREAVHRYDELKSMILDRLLEVFPTVRNLKILRSILWILGEYCQEKHLILQFMETLDKCMGTYPLVEWVYCEQSYKQEKRHIFFITSLLGNLRYRPSIDL